MRPRKATRSSALQNPAIQLFLCGLSCLFWELLLIRWLGCSIRVIAYYTNFVLISAFFGLGTGALLVRYRFRAWHFLIPALCFSILLGPLLGSFQNLNPANPHEYVWIGAPAGLINGDSAGGMPHLWHQYALPYWLILIITYLANTGIFVIFGQWIGALFSSFRPLKAYTIEIAGSLAGILLFALVSYFHLPPPAWFIIGLALVFCILELTSRERTRDMLLALVCVAAVMPFSNQFIWSRYYKIHISPLIEILDARSNQMVRFNRGIGARITVNNDYHQMIVDLHPRTDEHPFLQAWRWTYDYPYRPDVSTPNGPILIVGAGSGNDVSAALRNGVQDIDAVEIDPLIVELGRQYHPERPYDNPRVHVVVDDARSYFINTRRRYAKVVFGFLDSHTLMSSFSSLRLDNFVYTREAMERVKQLLVPGGKVVLTFASNTPWIHLRLVELLDSVFDYPTISVSDDLHGFSNGVIYINGRAPQPDFPASAAMAKPKGSIRLPTDDWPFLYMRDAVLPSHYKLFMILAVTMGFASLLLLPAGERSIKFPYFFMGAGFFLIETSNVVSLSLLYGSTWVVNIAVFTGILALILLGNLTCARLTRPHTTALFTLLFASVLIAYWTPTSALLAIQPKIVQGLCAVLVFLSPIYLASLIFGQLIASEPHLYRAYGSNLLGAVVGGACEYLSIVTGLKFLLILTLIGYFLAFVSIRTPSRTSARP